MASKITDTVMKWSPFIGVLGTGIVSGKVKTSYTRQLLVAAGSVLVQDAIVESLKKIIPERRPLPSHKKDSFPSGHTAASFAGAEMFRQETKDINPLFSYSGYLVGTTTAILRMQEKKHWLQDVIAGAIIGIASTQLTYRVHDKLKMKLEKNATG